MTKDEFIDYVKREHAGVAYSRKTAAIYRTSAAEVQEYDPLLATMLRRTALSIEQLCQQFEIQMININMDKSDMDDDEQEKLIGELFTRVWNKKS